MSTLKTYGPPIAGAVREAHEQYRNAREAYEGCEATLAAAIALLRMCPTDEARRTADKLDDFLSELPKFPRVPEDTWEETIRTALEAA